MSYNRGGYIGRAPSDSSVTVSKQYFEPTGAASTFTFSAGYDPGYLEVYRNGVKLVNPLDYAATDGSTITLTTPVGIGTTVEAIATKAYNVSNVEASTLNTTCNGTNLILSGDLTVEGDIEYDEVIGRNVNLSGVTTTVGLNVTGIGTFVDINVSGAVTANAFVGDGSALTGIGVTQYTDTGSLVVAGVSTLTGNVLVGASATVGFGSTVFFKDGNKLYFGDGEDLSIYHDGSHSYIDDTGTGGLYIDASGLTLRNANDENYAIFTSDGSTDLYFNNSKKFETTNSGSIITGILTVTSDVSIGGTLTYEDVTNIDSVGVVTARAGVNVSGGELTVGSGITMGIAGVATFSAGLVLDNPTAGRDVQWQPGSDRLAFFDNTKATFGDGVDLQLYHDGSHSYITNTTGDLKITDTSAMILATNSLRLRNGASDETYLAADNGSDVALYFNNSKKWETTNDGTVTTGIATATVGIDAAISVWTLGASGTDHYTFTGPGNLSATSDPTLNLKRGQKYTFKNRSGGHPFRIQSTPNGSAGTAYNTGVTNNDGGDGTNIIFDVPYNAPNVLYYQCTSHGNMGGAMYIDGSAYEISVGSGITFGSAGVATFSGTSDVHLLDNVELQCGDAGDLDLWHDGSHSYVRNVTGTLNIRSGSSVQIANWAGNETYASLTENGSVDLYYDNSKKFETTNDGTVTTGIATATEGDITSQLLVGSGITMGSAGVATFSGTADIHLHDNVRLNVGDSSDLTIYHDGSTSNMVNTSGTLNVGVNNFVVKRQGLDETMIYAQANSSVWLYYNDSVKVNTTYEGAKITGFTSTTAGMGVTGGLFEGSFIKAGKLSDNQTLGISTANVFYFTTQETTTATPNIVWNDSYSLSSKMAVGDVASVTVITTAAAGGYSANWTIDGNAVTEEWVGGSAPSAGGSDGLDIYSLTIIKTGTGTGDSGFKVIANVSNAT